MMFNPGSLVVFKQKVVVVVNGGNPPPGHATLWMGNCALPEESGELPPPVLTYVPNDDLTEYNGTVPCRGVTPPPPGYGK